MTDKQIIERHAPSVRQRAKIELRVAHKLIKAAHKAGYKLALDDGGEELTPIMTERELIDLIFNLDDSYLLFYKNAEIKFGEVPKPPTAGWVRLVMGNDGNIINDYTTNLNSIVEPIEEWMDREGIF